MQTKHAQNILLCGLVLTAIQVAPVARLSNPPLHPGHSIEATLPVPAEVESVLNNACKALLAPASFQVGGKQYVFATFATTAAGGLQYVGTTGLIVGLTMSPASAGDIITLYGIGFGPVTPNTAAGTLPTDSTSLTDQVAFLFGETPATVLDAGLSTDSVGLYQFHIEVPSVPGGDWPLTVQVGGTTLKQTIYVTTQ